MKDWKQEYINKFCTFEGENRMVFKNKITADGALDFIDKLISERDKEWVDKIDRLKVSKVNQDLKELVGIKKLRNG